MSAKITQFIGRNFDKKIVDNLGLFGRQKIKIRIFLFSNIAGKNIMKIKNNNAA